MAMVATPVINNPSYKSWNITALDADTSLVLAHGFGAAPDLAIAVSKIAAIVTDGINEVTVTTVDATNITVTKTAAAGSGGGTPGTTVAIKLYAMLPHSIMQ